MEHSRATGNASSNARPRVSQVLRKVPLAPPNRVRDFLSQFFTCAIELFAAL